MTAQFKYRPDIDGLRAMAVLPVVFFHLHVRYFNGGFVGVDIFFVISGYLITKLIWGEMENGDYSVTRFYVRRARRIFPALFFVSIVSAVLVVALCLPSEVKAFKESLIATALFVSNIYFYLTEDYFGRGAASLTLLHTWSLSVEEQFYIIFPFVLLAIHRYLTKLYRGAMFALFFISLAGSIWLSYSNPPAGFYLLHSRAWELLLGSLLAVGAIPPIKNRLLAEVAAPIGVVLIAISVHYYSALMPFPGAAALVPCLGAALIIHSGAQSQTLTAKLLALWPARFIGLISYSLYLWHWPVIVISDFLYFRRPHEFLFQIEMFALMVALATVSWHFVEKPFRRQPYRLGTNATLATTAAAMGVLVAVGFFSGMMNSRLLTIPASAERILAVLDYVPDQQMRTGVCMLAQKSADFSLFDQSKCLGLSSTKKDYLLIGDSHAAALWAGLAAANPDLNVLQATASGCKPIIGGDGAKRCTDVMRFVFEEFLPAHHVDTIVLNARWKLEDVGGAIATAKALQAFADRVVVFGPIVEYQHALPRTVVLSQIRNDASLIDFDRLETQQIVDAALASGLQGAGISYFSVYRAICPDAKCHVLADDGLPMQFDYGHLTLGGSTWVAKQAREAGAL
jgi:peptidoglycan/LPS O-acetylase OafA/YrhL